MTLAPSGAFAQSPELIDTFGVLDHELFLDPVSDWPSTVPHCFALEKRRSGRYSSHGQACGSSRVFRFDGSGVVRFAPGRS